jgi:hypothetical protein
VRARTGLAPRQHLAADIRRVVAGVAALLGGNIAVGAALLQRWGAAVAAALVCALAVLFLVRRGGSATPPEEGISALPEGAARSGVRA